MDTRRLKLSILDAASLTLKENYARKVEFQVLNPCDSFHAQGKLAGYAQGYFDAMREAVKLIEEAESEAQHAAS